jgi:hypothetical protein
VDLNISVLCVTTKTFDPFSAAIWTILANITDLPDPVADCSMMGAFLSILLFKLAMASN